ncbi:MAG: hypothetical protein U1F61_17015 [Opitutaceae bacterium]
MLVRHAIVTAAIVWALIFSVALGLAIYRHDLSSKSYLEYVWGISAACLLLGALFRGGAAKGDTIERIEGVIGASRDRVGYIRADSEDAVRGWAFGTIVLLAAGIIFAASLAILYAFYRR